MRLKLPPPERQRKTPADLLADLASEHPWDSDEYRALVAAGLRAPNQRHFNILSSEAWDLFRPPSSLLPPFPRCWTPKVERE